MRKETARCLAVHDMSGVGRCSLAVILPVMSVMGVQVCPLPTAVLSAHTGGFGDVASEDLTDYMQRAMEHYKKLGFGFDCIYTGYLNSTEQARQCLSLTEQYPDALKVVDPVMGDHGKLYRGFDGELVRGVSGLVAKADVITPNLTEACLLLGEKQPAAPLTAAEARSLLARLSALGPRTVVITGVTLAAGEYGNICVDTANNSYWKSTVQYLPVKYPGTGDIFAAVLTAALLSGESLPMAVDRATRYIELTIKTTYSFSTDQREGVMLERTLEWLTNREIPQKFDIL